MLRTLTQPLLEGEETCASPRSSLLLTSPPLTQSQCIGTPPLPEQIELHRDRMWRRDEDLRVERDVDAERFIEDVVFANTLTDPRRAGSSFRHRGVRSAGC